MKKYQYKNKIIEENPAVVLILNYALALNGSNERYILTHEV